MTENEFIDVYWKQFLMIEREFRKSIKCVALEDDNANAYSSFFIKLLLQIGSEVDVVAKSLCGQINASNEAETIRAYAQEILAVYPEIERLTVKREPMSPVKPWEDWQKKETVIEADGNHTRYGPEWWRIYNAVKHNRLGTETHYSVQKEVRKFATLRTVTDALAGLYVLELYLYQRVTDKNPRLDAPLPSSRVFTPMDCAYASPSW